MLCGNASMGQTLYTFNGGGTSGNWEDAAVWTTDPTGSTSVGARTPLSGDNLVVTNSYVLRLNTTESATNLNVLIQRGGMLDLTGAASGFANPLARLAGQGTLRVARPYFPVVTANDFDDANTGTVEFYNWPATPAVLPAPASGLYNNLRLLNTTATAFTAQLDNNLTLNGSLTLTRTTTADVTLNLGLTASANRTLTVLGTVTVGPGTNLGVTAVAGAHTLAINGSFVNNGTVRLSNRNVTNDDSQTALLQFNGPVDASFACNGPTDLSILKLDKGFDSQVTLNITSTVNPLNGFGNLRLNSGAADSDLLVLVNGVAKLGNNIYLPTIHNGATGGTGFTIGSTATSPTLWVAGATLINDNANGVIVYGTYRISAGRFQSVTPDAMVIREDAQVLVEGGTTLLDRFRPSNTSASHRGSFIMTGGTFEVNGSYVGTPVIANFARFAVPYLTQAFRMTGGTLRVANPANCTGLFHVGMNANNAVVTGGTVELLLPDTNTNATILSTAPLWNLTIKKPAVAGTTSKALLDAIAVNTSFTAGATTTAQPLTVLNNLMLDATNPTTFDANSQNVTIQGSFTIGAGCTYLPTTNTTTFSGAQNQLLTNNGTIGAASATNTFANLTMNKPAGTFTLAGTVSTFTVTGTLTLVDGVLNDGGKTVNAQGNVVNSAAHTSGGGSGSIVLNGAGGQTVGGDGTGVFGNLKLNSTNATAGAVAATLTANMAVTNVLTLQSTHVLGIGSNRLSLTNISVNAVSAPGGFSSQKMIQTAGNQSDLGLQKTYGGPDTFTFPVGTGTKYTPAIIQLSLATGLSRYGQVSVSPTNKRSPFVTSPNSLAYYWKVRSVGFGPIPTGAINHVFEMINTDAAGTLANYIPGWYLPVAWTSYNDPNLLTKSTTISDIAFNGLDQFDGEFTAGELAAFGPITSYYSRASGNWETPATWSTTGFTGAAAAAVPGANNPVFIGSAAGALFHTVTVTANTATSGSLVIDRGSVLNVQTTTGHNFGALPDAKAGGAGRLRIGGTTTAVFPGGDFGSFLQPGGGTVEYYTNATQNFTLPVSSATGLALASYRNLWLNAATGRTITLPNQDLRVFAQLKAGTPTTFPGLVALSAAAAGNLRADSLLAVQAGTLRYPNTTARTVTVDTDVRIDASATFDVNATGTVVTNALSVGGSLTNNGALNLSVSGRTANLTFTGAQNASLTGTTGTATTLATLAVNKGATQTPTLTVDVAGPLTTPTTNWLTLTNGTLRYAKPSSTLTIHDATGPYLIPNNAGLTVDAPSATVTVATANDATADLKLAGQLRVLQGTLNVGTAATGAGNDLEYASAGTPTIRVSGTGALYVNGQVRRTTANTNGSLRYDQSGGTVEVGGFGATAAANNERGLFEVQGPGSIFRQTGGSLTLRRSNGRPTAIADLYLRPDSTVVTAGTVVLGNLATGAGNVTVSVESLVPLYDLRVEAGADAANTNTGLLTGLSSLNLKGSLTIANDNAFFNANGLGLNIDQNLANNNSSTSTALNGGGFRPTVASQTTTFTGKGPVVQQLTSTAANLTVFGGLVLNNAQAGGTLQLGRNALVAGTTTLTKGTLADNGQTLTALGDVLNSATHTSTGAGSLTLGGTVNQTVGGNGTGRFGNVVLNNAAGATAVANQEITSVLTLTNGVLNIGSNLLWLSNPAAGAVAGTFSATRAIRTNGIVADLGLRKSYPAGALDFTFPLGVAGKYTPVQMNVTGTAAAGTITVRPVDQTHPSTTDPAAKELRYFWKVSSTGFSAPTVTQAFSYVSLGPGNDVNGTESLYKLGRFLNGAWTPQGGVAVSTVNTTTHTLSNPGATYFDGDYTGGEASEFGAVPTFYSRNATAGLAGGATWDSPAAWTFSPDGTDSAPLPSTFPTQANPVVVLSGHLINANGPGRGAANLLLQGTLDVSAFGANNFNTVTGTGTLRIGSALFPAGNYADFVAAGTGGTVDFSGAVQLPARDTYNNLTFSGGNAKDLSNLDLTLNGGLTVAANTTVNNPTSQNITLRSATGGATVNGTLNLNDGNLAVAGSLTNAGTLQLGAGAVSTGTTFTTSGTVNNGSGAVTVGTAFANSGTYNATAGLGTLAVGTTFANSGTYNAGTGKLTVGSDFTNSAGTFTAATGDVNVGGNFANAATYAATTANVLRVTGNFSNAAASSFVTDVSTLVLRGNFTNAGSFNAGTFNAGSLVQFLADANHVLTGTTTFINLQKLGAATLTLGPSTNVTVAGLLTLQSGLITTGLSNILSLTNTATQPIVGTGPGAYVSGRLAMTLPNAAASIRTFPVGLSGRFRPVTIKPQGTSASPVVLVEIFSAPPGGTIDATLSNISANRYYRVQLLSGTIAQPSVQLSFNTDVVDEEVHVPGNLRVAKSVGAGGPWSTAGGAGVYSPDYPRGYTISGAPASSLITANSFFALASTNYVDNPLTGSIPLPVELLTFSATASGPAVRLAWATASEKNAAYFLVQRSSDGRQFADVARQEAQGNTSSRHEYAALDAAPLPGLSYYRLRQVDQDGHVSHSPIVTVRFAGPLAAPALVAYPNPASASGFRLQAVNLGATGGTIRVLDHLGRLVLTQDVAENTVEATIRPAQPLPPGLYVATWQSTSGGKLTTKVVVE